MILTLALYLGEFHRMWKMPALNTETNSKTIHSKAAVKTAR